MCGICGVINFDNSLVSDQKIQSMMKVMKHRGPNDDGLFIDKNVGFGFVRLSIIDLSSSGHQPFKSDDERFVLIFNGEIYNYLEIKIELEALGHEFRTKTDTEVLLKSYVQWGEQAFHRFNGMWALAIYDVHEKTVFFSRDRYGIKPFYYYQSENSFYFASEINALLAIKESKNEANLSVIYNYLVYNKTEQNKETFFKEIYKLLHGESLQLPVGKKPNEIRPKKWYNLAREITKNPGFKNSSDYKELLIDAVKIHLRSDVSIGVSFSGGIDSTAIAGLILEQHNVVKLETFSAVYEQYFVSDEKKFIDIFENNKLEKNFIYPNFKGFLEEMDEFISCQSEPTPTTSPYSQFKVMQQASKKVQVMLDGQGADEQLAGYHYFFGFYFKDLFKKMKWFKLLKEIFYYIKLHNSFFALKTFFFFLLPTRMRSNLKISEIKHLNLEFLKDNKKDLSISENLYGSSSLKDALVNHFEYKLEHLLKWEDRNSMHFSIEARVPFLDHRLVEKTLASQMDLIIRNGESKHILREALKGIIPEEIRIRRDKIGYVTPEDDWFRTEELRSFILDLFQSEKFKSRAIFDVDKVLEMYKKHYNNEKNSSREIWKCINLELWYRKYID
ncbi:MAG: asparagine synthase (glutamine-hydrolyzing) [Flavobacteriia bacterium]|jgi:asparagine synthase (glutamine-hydrolysing)